MRDKKKDAEMMAKKREEMLQTAYELFSKKDINTVAMADIARITGYGNTTLHRYFKSKPVLVVAVATWKWEEYLSERVDRRLDDDFEHMTAAQQLDFYLGAFIELYSDHRDMLRFNQFFNIYVRAEQIDPEVLKPYQELVKELYSRFDGIYEKAKKDHTVRTDISERKLFTATLHLMLAAVTRYAVGLVYQPRDGTTPEEELGLLKDMLIREYALSA